MSSPSDATESSSGGNTVAAGVITNLPDTLQRVVPRTIPGPVSTHNKGALHWSDTKYVLWYSFSLLFYYPQWVVDKLYV